MAFTYDLTTDVGKVRLLIPDRNVQAYDDGDTSQWFFEDEEIEALLTMEGDNVKRAAALALETIASDEAYVQKAIRLMDLQTNGAQTAASLMARAAELRKQADKEEEGAYDEWDYAEWVVNDFSGRERVEKGWLRG